MSYHSIRASSGKHQGNPENPWRSAAGTLVNYKPQSFGRSPSSAVRPTACGNGRHVSTCCAGIREFLRSVWQWEVHRSNRFPWSTERWGSTAILSQRLRVPSVWRRRLFYIAHMLHALSPRIRPKRQLQENYPAFSTHHRAALLSSLDCSTPTTMSKYSLTSVARVCIVSSARWGHWSTETFTFSSPIWK